MFHSVFYYDGSETQLYAQTLLLYYYISMHRQKQANTTNLKKLKEEIPRQQLQQVQQMHKEDLPPETASSYKKGVVKYKWRYD